MDYYDIILGVPSFSLFPLSRNYMDAYDTYLVMAFVGETRVLGMDSDEELGEADIPGFDASVQVSLGSFSVI